MAVAGKPKIQTRRKRKPKQLAVINECCTGCAGSPVCHDLCPVEDCMVLVPDEPDAPVFGRTQVNPLLCIGCKRCTTKGPDGVCLDGCPWNAIDMVATQDFEALHGEMPY